MIDLLRKLFNKPDSDPSLIVDNKGNVRFILLIDKLNIGYLYIVDGKWKFEYSDEFKLQNKYRKIDGFSDLNKIYESEVLWPFFKIRIPGLKQPMIKEILNKEKIDKSNEAILLKRFGKRAVSNPYILEPVN